MMLLVMIFFFILCTGCDVVDYDDIACDVSDYHAFDCDDIYYVVLESYVRAFAIGYAVIAYAAIDYDAF